MQYDGSDFVAEYVTGKSIKYVCLKFKINNKTLVRHLKLRGIKPRGKKIPIPDNIIPEYLSGKSVKYLSDKYKLPRISLTAFLKSQNIDYRNRSEAEILKWKQMTPRQRKHQMKAYHDSMRGSKRSHKEVCKRALVAEKGLYKVGGGEILLADYLRNIGIVTIPQKAVDIYNVDLAVTGNIAIEVHVCTRNPLTFPFTRNRIINLLKFNWSIVYVWVSHNHFLTEGAAKDIHSFIQNRCLNKTFFSQYRVIRGDGDFVACGSIDGEKLT